MNICYTFSYLQTINYDTQDVQLSLQHHRITGHHESKELNLYEKLENPSLQNQIQYLGVINNAPFNINNIKNKVSYQRNLSVRVVARQFPFSIRNRIIHLMMTSESCEKELEKLRKMSIPDETKVVPDAYNTTNKKTRQYRPRTVEVSRQNVLDHTGENMANNSLIDQQFETYLHCQLLGDIYWRCHSEAKDIFVLNETDINHGVLMPTMYVHICVTHDIEFIVQCDCHTSTLLAGFIGADEVPSINGVTCMHTRLLKQYLFPNYQEIVSNTTLKSNILNKMKEALNKCGNPIQQLSSTNDVTIKYSVQGTDDTYSIVHISHNREYIACQSGICNIEMGLCSRKRSRKLLALNESEKLCPHLEMMLTHAVIWSDVIPLDFTEEHGNVCY